MKNTLKLIATVSALTVPVTLAACAPAEQGTSPGYSLSAKQTASIDTSVRLGRMGLQTYDWALMSQDKVWTNGKLFRFEDTNLKSFPGMAIPLGHALKIGRAASGRVDGEPASFKKGTIIVPATDSTKSSVTFRAHTDDMVHMRNESLTLSNPDPNIFGDSFASPEEMRAFYTSPDTTVVELVSYVDDIVDGAIDFKAHRVGRKLKVELQETDHELNDISPDINAADIVEIIKRDILYDN